MNIWTEKQDSLLLSSYYASDNKKQVVKEMAQYFKTTRADVDERIRYLQAIDNESDIDVYV